jgi:hypothetical protein
VHASSRRSRRGRRPEEKRSKVMGKSKLEEMSSNKTSGKRKKKKVGR